MKKILFLSGFMFILFSIPVYALAPDVYIIETIPAQDPTEGTTTTITFNVSVNDPDGFSDISVVNASFNKTGEATRMDSSCSSGNTINSTAINYSCSVDMWFYDDSGTWSMEIYAEDTASSSDTEWSSFDYNTLTAWNMTPSSIVFPHSYQDDTNVLAYNYTTMQNTGNVNLTTIEVNATNLIGTSSSDVWNAGNFSVNIVNESEGNQMSTNTFVTIVSALLPRGLSSFEELYFCIETVPSFLTTDAYDTSINGDWTVRSMS